MKVNTSIPSVQVIERYDERLVEMQITKEEKKAIRKKASDPILVICDKDYHHGVLGMFKKDNVYAIPAAMYKELEKGRLRGKKIPLRHVKKDEAMKQLKANKASAEKLRREHYRRVTGGELEEAEEINIVLPGEDEDEKDTKSPNNKAARSTTRK